jgi:hypothetical protein
MDEQNIKKLNWKKIFYILLIPLIAVILFLSYWCSYLLKPILHCEGINNEYICKLIPYCYYRRGSNHGDIWTSIDYGSSCLSIEGFPYDRTPKPPRYKLE